MGTFADESSTLLLRYVNPSRNRFGTFPATFAKRGLGGRRPRIRAGRRAPRRSLGLTRVSIGAARPFETVDHALIERHVGPGRHALVPANWKARLVLQFGLGLLLRLRLSWRAAVVLPVVATRIAMLEGVAAVLRAFAAEGATLLVLADLDAGLTAGLVLVLLNRHEEALIGTQEARGRTPLRTPWQWRCRAPRRSRPGRQARISLPWRNPVASTAVVAKRALAS